MKTYAVKETTGPITKPRGSVSVASEATVSTAALTPGRSAKTDAVMVMSVSQNFA